MLGQAAPAFRPFVPSPVVVGSRWAKTAPTTAMEASYPQASLPLVRRGDGHHIPTRDQYAKDYDAIKNALCQPLLTHSITPAEAARKLGVTYSTARFREDTLDLQILHDIAAFLASLGYDILSGGGPGGMLYTAQGAAMIDPKRSFSVAIRIPSENPNPYSLEIQTAIADSFLSRKAGVGPFPDFYNIAPGGLGTLEEFFEVVALMAHGHLPWRPLFLIEAGKEHSFVEPVKALLASMQTDGLIDPAVQEQLSQHLHVITGRSHDEILQNYAQTFLRVMAEKESQLSQLPLALENHADKANHDIGVIDDYFDPLDMGNTVTVFGHDSATATKLMTELMSTGATVLLGGSPQVLEAALAVDALETGALIAVGLADESLSDESLGKIKVSNNVAWVPFHLNSFRKAALTSYSKAYVFDLGGIDTFDLLTEILTLIQTRKISKAPVVLINSSTDKKTWQALQALLQKMVRLGTISPKDLELFTVVGSVEAATNYLKQLPSQNPISENEPLSVAPQPLHVDLHYYATLFKKMEVKDPEQTAQKLINHIGPKVTSAVLLQNYAALLQEKKPQALGQLNDLELFEGPSAERRIMFVLAEYLKEMEVAFTLPTSVDPEIKRFMAQVMELKRQHPDDFAQALEAFLQAPTPTSSSSSSSSVAAYQAR